MLKVLSQSSAAVLSPEHQIEWIDLTGKELQIAESEKDGVFSITLDVKPQGAKKVSTPLLLIATVAIAAEVSGKYAEDELLKPAIVAFLYENIQGSVALISQMVELAEQESRTIDLTHHQSVSVSISERIERDDADVVVSSAIVADVDGKAYTYSTAGVFDNAG